MLVRHAEPALDAAACAALYAPFVSDGVASLEEVPPTDGEMASRIERISTRYPWLVAGTGREVLGFAYASQHRERASYRWVVDVTAYVAPAHQRRGVGRALYGALMPLIARQGMHVACAGITLPNDASVALHESFGFRPVGVYRRIGWKAGAWRDVGWWELQLVSPSSDGAQPAEPGPPVRIGGG
jgi:phosphinothricin acetyltransferase